MTSFIGAVFAGMVAVVLLASAAAALAGLVGLLSYRRRERGSTLSVAGSFVGDLENHRLRALRYHSSRVLAKGHSVHLRH